MATRLVLSDMPYPLHLIRRFRGTPFEVPKRDNAKNNKRGIWTWFLIDARVSASEWQYSNVLKPMCKSCSWVWTSCGWTKKNAMNRRRSMIQADSCLDVHTRRYYNSRAVQLAPKLQHECSRVSLVVLLIGKQKIKSLNCFGLPKMITTLHSGSWCHLVNIFSSCDGSLHSHFPFRVLQYYSKKNISHWFPIFFLSFNDRWRISRGGERKKSGWLVSNCWTN